MDEELAEVGDVSFDQSWFFGDFLEGMIGQLLPITFAATELTE